MDFFEKIQSMEKKKPGTMSKVFSTHPMTDDRIQTAQKNIQELLKERPEYVVTTSEFNDVKGRLMALHNSAKVDNQDLNRPTLRKAPGAGTSGSDKDKGGSDDDRPTLKRRPDQFHIAPPPGVRKAAFRVVRLAGFSFYARVGLRRALGAASRAAGISLVFQSTPGMAWWQAPRPAAEGTSGSPASQSGKSPTRRSGIRSW